MRINGWIGGAAASSIVGASFPVSESLIDYPYAAGQCVRYLAGAIILTLLLKGRLGRPTLRELGLLALVAAVGMVGFNLAVLATVERLGATNAGVVIGASPVVLALLVPILARRRPRAPFVAAALVVAAGAAVVNGADDRLTLIGLALAIGALLGEVGFTLLAAPLLPRLGPMRVAAWAAWLATVELLVLTAGEIPMPTRQETAAIAYLAVITTALAFVLWFGAVQQLGGDRAGLLVGLMPIAAVTVDALLNGHAPSTADLAGTALVATGVVVGARPRRARARSPRGGTRAASAASTAGTSSTCPAASSSPAAALPGRSSRR
jgi:drug/metabolite transporter (DMT)-like permease